MVFDKTSCCQLVSGAFCEGPNGAKQYPSMYGAEGWYGWSNAPWNVGATDLWYWTQKPEDRKRIGGGGWVGFLEGQNPNFPEQSLEQKYADAAPYLRALHDEVLGTPQLRAISA